jgi:Concanavalin A-like lectin/glucanases superfamily
VYAVAVADRAGPGNAGGNSTFDGTGVVAHGAAAPASFQTGAIGGTGSANSIHFNGGNGAGYTSTPPGGGYGGGSSGGPSAPGNNGSNASGYDGGKGGTAVTGGGPGGAGGNVGQGGRDPASSPGGGGGGWGAGGLVKLTYFVTVETTTTVTQVLPGVLIQVQATWDSVTYNLFTGTADGWADGGLNNPHYAEVTLTGSDGLSPLSLNNLDTIASSGANEDSGARINRILDFAGWDPAMRNIDTGDSPVQATTLDDYALNLMQLASDTEVGSVYQDASGNITFRRRSALITDPRSVIPQAVFGDENIAAAGTSNTPYATLVAADSPLVWWELADPAGTTTIADSSGNGNTATATSVYFQGTGLPVLGSAGQGTAAFSSRYPAGIVSAYNPALATMACETWVNLYGITPANSPAVLLGTDSSPSADSKGFLLSLTESAGDWYPVISAYGSAAATVTSSVPVAASGWSYVIATYDGTTLRLYLNGALTGSAALSGTIPAGSVPLSAGTCNSAGWLDGVLGQAALYSTALSAADIAARWVSGTTRLPYFKVTRACDNTTLANDIQITPNGSSTLSEASSQVSIFTYRGPRTYTRTDLLITSTAEALEYAQFVLCISLDAEDRFDTLTLLPFRDTADLYAAVLPRDIGDKITVWRQPPNVAAFSKDEFITGIQHAWSYSPLQFQTDFTLMSADKYASFATFDNPVSGRFDYDAFTY